MPLAGYVCPPGMPTAGQRNDISYCLRGGTPGGCPHPCVSPPLLAAMYRAEHKNHHKGIYISASMLTGHNCARRVRYERMEPFWEQPVKRFWPYRGTIAHAVIEGAGDMVAEYGWMQELRMSVDLEYPEHPAPIFDKKGVWTGRFSRTKRLVLTLGGTTDAYNPLTVPPELDDFKSMADAKVEMMAKGTKGGTFSKNLDDAHVWQTNIYRFLVSRTPIPDKVREQYGLTGKFFPAPEKLVIQGFGMMNLPKSGTPIELKVRKGKYSEYVIYEIDEVPVLPLEQIEAYIRPRLFSWYEHLILGKPAPPVDEEDKWLCKFCTFNGEMIEGERCFPERDRKALYAAQATRLPVIQASDPYAEPEGAAPPSVDLVIV